MTDLTVITGAAWPTSGAASTATVPATTVTGLTHAPHGVTPPSDCLSTGILKGVDDAAVTLRPGPTTELFGSVGDEAWLKATLILQRTATTLQADGTDIDWWTFTNTGTKGKMDGETRNNSVCPGLMLNLQVTEYAGTGTREAMTTMGATTNANAPASVAFGVPVELVLHAVRASSGAEVGIYQAGVLLCRYTGLDTETTMSQTGLRNAFTNALPAVAGGRWEFVSTQKTWNGNIADLVSPRFDDEPTTSHVAKFFHAHVINVGNGCMWDGVGTGTAAAVCTSYGSAGIYASRKRFIITGTNGDTYTLTTRQKLGAPTYNGNGVCSIQLPMGFVSAGSAVIDVLADDNTTVLKSLTITAAELRIAGSKVTDFFTTRRYMIDIELRQDGTCAWGTLDLTSATDAATKGASAAFGTWTPQNLGKLRITCTIGATGQEWDGVGLCRWVDIAGPDSLTAIASNGLATIYQVPNHVAREMPCGLDTLSLPNGNYPGRNLGMERWAIYCTGGFTGKKFPTFVTSVVTPLAALKGIAWYIPDVASINDMAAITDATTATTIVAGLMTALDTMWATAGANGNLLWLHTGMRREFDTYGGAGSFINNAIDAHNVLKRAWVARNQRRQQILFSDPAAALADHTTLFTPGTDKTHFNAAGDTEYFRLSVVNRTTPPEPDESIAGLGLGLGLGVAA